MDYSRPERVLKKADEPLKAEILHAYGEFRSPEAVNAVFDYIDVEDKKVRRAARWALRQYISGPPPKAATRKLTLTGGRKTAQEESLYLTYRELAKKGIVDRLASYQPVDKQHSEQPEGQGLEADGEMRYLAERLFFVLDRRREQRQQEPIEKAIGKAQQGKLQEAIDAFDKGLELNPFHPYRSRMAPFYFQLGKRMLKAGNYQQAMVFTMKAIYLDPEGAFVEEAKAYQSLAEALSNPSPEISWRLRAAVEQFPALKPSQDVMKQMNRLQLRGMGVAAALGGMFSLLLILSISFVRRMRPDVHHVKKRGSTNERVHCN
jgi:tetratricopeptide (TPR) repeat protein